MSKEYLIYCDESVEKGVFYSDFYGGHPETGLRGKRTVAKESLYKHISAKIREIHPNFNIGKTTGKRNGWTDIWENGYRHWSFMPNDVTVDETRFKKGQ